MAGFQAWMRLQSGWAPAQRMVIVVICEMLAHWALELRDMATRQKETEERQVMWPGLLPLPFCSLVFLLKLWDRLVGPG